MGKRVAGRRDPSPPKHEGSYDENLDRGISAIENTVGVSGTGRRRKAGVATGPKGNGVGAYTVYSRNGEFIAGHGG